MAANSLQKAAAKLFAAADQYPCRIHGTRYISNEHTGGLSIMYARTASLDSIVVEYDGTSYSVAWMKPGTDKYVWYSEPNRPLELVLGRAKPAPATNDWVWGVIEDGKIVEVLTFGYTYPESEARKTPAPHHNILVVPGYKSSLEDLLLLPDHEMKINDFWKAVKDDRLQCLTHKLKKTVVATGRSALGGDLFVLDVKGDHEQVLRSLLEPPREAHEPPLTEMERRGLTIRRFY